MATHKVPQDVEADDKLVGPLSLKQFILTVLGLGFGYLTGFFFIRIHPITAVIWIPPTIVCLVLGLYQRKDQPVEVFLASALRYYLKPRQRLWNQEGYEERVRITAPPKIDRHYTKDFSGDEAFSRLGNLSRLMDSRGWTTKLITDYQNPQLATAAASDRLVQPTDIQHPGIDPQLYMQPADMMDEASNPMAQDFQSMVSQTSSDAKQRALEVIEEARTIGPSPTAPAPTAPTLSPQQSGGVAPVPATDPVQAASTPISTPVSPQVIAPTPEPPRADETDSSDGVEIKLH